MACPNWQAEAALPPNWRCGRSAGVGQGRRMPASAASEPLTDAERRLSEPTSQLQRPVHIPNCLHRKPSQFFVPSPLLLSNLVRCRPESPAGARARRGAAPIPWLRARRSARRRLRWRALPTPFVEHGKGPKAASVEEAVVNEINRPRLVCRQRSRAHHAQVAQPFASSPSAQ